MDTAPGILIVEDEVLVAENLKVTIEDAGYRVTGTARNRNEAMDTLRASDTDLVLMDILLEDGKCGGIDLEKTIHEEFRTPVIFLTALSDRETLDRAKESHSYGYLLKPIHEKELLIAIETALKRHNLEKALRLSEEKFRSIYEASPIGIELYGPDGRLTQANNACLRMFGAEDLDDVQVFNLFDDPNLPVEVRELLLKGETVRYESTFDFSTVRDQKRNRTAKRGTLTLDVLITPLTGRSKRKEGYLVHIQDITSRKIFENTLRELSLTDQLTGLYNRRGFLKLASQHAAIASRTGEPLTVYFLDLNGMKRINDLFGHGEGDRALILTAGVLRKTFRNTDVLARWGGDEFAVLMVDAKKGWEESVGNRLSEAVEEVNAEGRLKHPLGLSWGFSSYDPGEGESIEDVVSRADQAMYRHKRGDS